MAAFQRGYLHQDSRNGKKIPTSPLRPSAYEVSPMLSSNFAPAGSALHVVHAAAVLLDLLPKTTTPADIIARVQNVAMRTRIEAALAKNGLVEKEVRALAEACGMHLWRPNTRGFDPHHPEPTEHGYWAALIGDKTERRYVLVLQHTADKLTILDPAGPGVTSMTPKEFSVVWTAAARKGVRWAGSLWIDRKGKKVVH